MPNEGGKSCESPKLIRQLICKCLVSKKLIVHRCCAACKYQTTQLLFDDKFVLPDDEIVKKKVKMPTVEILVLLRNQ